LAVILHLIYYDIYGGMKYNVDDKISFILDHK